MRAFSYTDKLISTLSLSQRRTGAFRFSPRSQRGILFNRTHKQLPELERVFLEPANPTQRQYEALRAYFVEGLPSQEVAKRFGYTPGSFRVLCHQFRHNPQRPFCLLPQQGPQSAPKRDPVRDHVIALRKQNLSIYDMRAALKAEGQSLSPVALSLL